MFDVYLALGDSMSIDYYPAQDAERAGIECRDEIGSASLLYRNENAIFPEFDGVDLATRYPGIQYANLAIDGATTEDLLSEIRDSDLSEYTTGRALVTLTLGGNDLLQVYRRSQGQDRDALLDEFTKVTERYDTVLRKIRRLLPECVLIVTTVFDPTDGTGIMPTGTCLYDAKLPIEFLTSFNSYVKQAASSHVALLADVHKHFLGHGADCGAAEQFWYWSPSPIEPSYTGASEIRRVWIETLESSRLLTAPIA